MERIIKSVFILVIGFLSGVMPVCSAEQVQQNKIPQAEFQTHCVKTFPIGYEKLYYLTLCAINEYNYQIKEIQTKGGYILFVANSKKILGTIVYVSSSKSMLKLTPYDSEDSFSIYIPQNIFKYIEDNKNKNF